MSYSVTLEDVFSVRADAAVLGIENPVVPADGAVFQRLAQQGGEPLLREMRKLRFLSVGRAAAVSPCGLPFQHLILAASPRWNNGEANELPVLRISYRSVFDLAEQLGVRRLAMPFLSVNYYRFPQEEAIQIALTEASARDFEVLFLAEDACRLSCCQQASHKPEIVSYVGYYRDHAVFALDNGLFAFVDLRPELEQVTLRSYYDPCYLAETDPLRIPLSEAEINRLRGIYQHFCL